MQVPTSRGFLLLAHYNAGLHPAANQVITTLVTRDSFTSRYGREVITLLKKCKFLTQDKTRPSLSPAPTKPEPTL